LFTFQICDQLQFSPDWGTIMSFKHTPSHEISFDKEDCVLPLGPIALTPIGEE